MGGGSGGGNLYCMKEGKGCVGWVEKFFKDCLCNLRDEVSFGLGMVSLVCWGVAEIPQIVTNFHTKSGHGVSLAFLLTWVTGDVFNLVGCLLEPATLPTQLYTALLYTISTIVLVLQTIYYDYIRNWFKRKHKNTHSMVNEVTKPLKPNSYDSKSPSLATPLKVSSHSDTYYYMSARSLASSGTPPYGSTYLGRPKSGPSAFALGQDDSSDEDSNPTHSQPLSQPINIPRSVGYGTFLAASLNFPHQCKGFKINYGRLHARKLLQDSGTKSNVYGLWLGWMMAAIYMGGRIPQICLNIKRGSVEGLNPLMFVFALIANVTYVGSILVRSTEWAKIKANMPWLLDAVVCVALDLFIILQFVYYRFIRQAFNGEKEDHGISSKGALKAKDLFSSTRLEFVIEPFQ